MKKEYTGKKFSILADSISTFKGCNPEGYNVFYDGEKIAETELRPQRTRGGAKLFLISEARCL